MVAVCWGEGGGLRNTYSAVDRHPGQGELPLRVDLLERDQVARQDAPEAVEVEKSGVVRIGWRCMQGKSRWLGLFLHGI